MTSSVAWSGVARCRLRYRHEDCFLGDHDTWNGDGLFGFYPVAELPSCQIATPWRAWRLCERQQPVLNVGKDENSMAKGRVLIVDDEASEAKIFRFYLEALPVDAKVAHSTEEATSLLGV